MAGSQLTADIPKANQTIEVESHTPIVALVEEPQSIESLITKKARAAGVNTETALRIARCESSLRQFTDRGEVLRGESNPADVGLFQINEKYHLQKSQELGYDIYTTNGNIDYAMWVMKHEGAKHWHWSQSCWGK